VCSNSHFFLGELLTFRRLDSLEVYKNEDDATEDLAEFTLATAIYLSLTEGRACEQSAR